jgi:hypothetical protein
LERPLGIALHGDLVAGLLESLAEGAADIDVVVYDEQAHVIVPT